MREIPLDVGDTLEEAGPDGDRIFSWQLAIADRPAMFDDRRLPRGRRAASSARLTPALVVRDTLAVFCKADDLPKA